MNLNQLINFYKLINSIKNQKQILDQDNFDKILNIYDTIFLPTNEFVVALFYR